MNDSRSALVHAQPTTQDWVPTSKTGTVLRRRVFRLGGPESGRVTSVVTYKPGAAFPTHPHPQGEEILVLDGVFSDWRGHHKAGTFLLNPEGFEHAPTSEAGCLLFVRLRQFPGTDRPQKAIDTNTMEWDPLGRKVLMDSSFDDPQYMQLVPGGSTVDITVPAEGLEAFVVDGEVQCGLPDGNHALTQYDWLRVPDSGATLALSASSDAVVLVKENTLRSAFAELEAA